MDLEYSEGLIVFFSWATNQIIWILSLWSELIWNHPFLLIFVSKTPSFDIRKVGLAINVVISQCKSPVIYFFSFQSDRHFIDIEKPFSTEAAI